MELNNLVVRTPNGNILLFHQVGRNKFKCVHLHKTEFVEAASTYSRTKVEELLQSSKIVPLFNMTDVTKEAGLYDD